MVNSRPLVNLVATQFVFDLYDQFDPLVNVFRFRNVLAVYKRPQMWTYTPSADWDYITAEIARLVRSQEWPAKVTRLEELCARKKSRLDTLLVRFDQERTALGTASRHILAQWLLDLYYTPLNDIFVLNLAPVEAGIHRFLKEASAERRITPVQLSQYLRACADRVQFTTVAVEDRARLIKEALREHAGDGSPTQLRDCVEDIIEHSIGYGSEPRPAESVMAEYREYLSMSPVELHNLLVTRDVPDCEPIDADLDHTLLLYSRIGHLRDRNKALLGRAVARRHVLLDIIAERQGLDREELDLYHLQELVELVERGRRADASNRASCVVLQSAITLMTGQRAAATASVLTPRPQTHLEGTVASPGRTRGSVRIVDTPEAADRFARGEVLVATGTDFHLLSAMQRAAAVVTEEGGLLSHASVVCRELGIPCLIDVTYATRALRTGDLVEVDAYQGCVRKTTAHKASPSTDLPPWLQPDDIGSKAAMLLKVSSLGLNVAPFHSLGKAFFLRWLACCGLTSADLQGARSQAAAAAVIKRIPEHDVTALLAPLLASSKAFLLAVRSSAEYEDNETHSFAGMLCSVLNVEAKPQPLMAAIVTCWSAVYESRFREYLKVCNPLAAEPWCVPLIVQSMVRARVSGVSFTCDPVTGLDVTVNEISTGGCERLTEGVPADERLLWRRHDAASSTLLSSAELKLVRETLDVLTFSLGPRLDIEWSIDHAGMLFVHQVRPVTTVHGVA